VLKHGILAIGVVMAAGLLAMGCGETSGADPTPVQTWKITPASGGGAPTATPAPVEETPTQPSGGSGGGTVLELVGANTLFDKDELEAPAGTVTIEFDNRDGGIPHNVAVYEGEDATDDSVGATELEVGPVQQTLTLELEPGTYFYQCDAHPSTMSGILTVT
jgi:plastocyanin